MSISKQEIQMFLSFLYLKHPFYNSLISNFNIELEITEKSEEFKLYIENSYDIKIDENFANKLVSKNKKRLFYFLLHEVLHILLNHPLRKNNRIDEKWDQAADIVVDNIIKQDDVLNKLISFPEEDKNIVKIYDYEKKVSKSVEEVYENLKYKEKNKEKKKSCSKNNNNKSNNNCCSSSNNHSKNNKNKSNKHLSNHASWSKVKINEQKNKEIIFKAAEFSKLTKKEFGGMPGSFIEQIEDLLTPKTNLKSYLNKIIQSFKKESNTYKRGDRRYLYKNLIVPSKIKNIKHFNLLFFIDTSGSMDIEDLGQSMSEIIDLLQTLKSFNIEIIYSDTKISDKIILDEKSEIDIPKLLEIKGRGGTELTPLFNYIEDNEKKYDAIIVNTDFFISNHEFQEYLEKENEYNFLGLVPVSHNEEKVKKIKNKFLIGD